MSGADIRHTLIVGITSSGKTTLAKVLAQKSKRTKIIFSPTLDFSPAKNQQVFHTEEDFLAALYEAKNCDVFIDEADTILPNVIDMPHKWLTQRGRHLGLRAFIITQRPAVLNKTIRANCAECYMFRLEEGDAKQILKDFAINAPPPNLAMRQFVYLYPGVQELRVVQMRKIQQAEKKSSGVLTRLQDVL